MLPYLSVRSGYRPVSQEDMMAGFVDAREREASNLDSL